MVAKKTFAKKFMAKYSFPPDSQYPLLSNCPGYPSPSPENKKFTTKVFQQLCHLLVWLPFNTGRLFLDFHPSLGLSFHGLALRTME